MMYRPWVATPFSGIAAPGGVVGFQEVWPCAMRLVPVTAKTETHRIVVSLSNLFIESPNFGPVTRTESGHLLPKDLRKTLL